MCSLQINSFRIEYGLLIPIEHMQTILWFILVFHTLFTNLFDIIWIKNFITCLSRIRKSKLRYLLRIFLQFGISFFCRAVIFGFSYFFSILDTNDWLLLNVLEEFLLGHPFYYWNFFDRFYYIWRSFFGLIPFLCT